MAVRKKLKTKKTVYKKNKKERKDSVYLNKNFGNKLNKLSNSFDKKNIKTILNISKDKKFIETVQKKLSIGIAIILIGVILIGIIINYLSDLQRCKCFNETNDNNYSNITYLIVIEAIILIFYIIMLLMLIGSYMGIDKIKKGGYYNENEMMMYYLSFIIMLFIYSFFIYYVIKLHQNIKDDCQCAVSPVRYLLYIQTFLMIIVLIGSIINLSGK
jgi:hypothetical protein